MWWPLPEPARKPGDHAGRQHCLALVGHQSRLAFEYVDELVLPFVPVALRRPGAGRQLEHIDAELREAEDIAQRAADRSRQGTSCGAG